MFNGLPTCVFTSLDMFNWVMHCSTPDSTHCSYVMSFLFRVSDEIVRLTIKCNVYGVIAKDDNTILLKEITLDTVLIIICFFYFSINNLTV